MIFTQKKKQQKKKTQLKFTVDCTHPVEDGIMDVANFVSNDLIVFFLFFNFLVIVGQLNKGGKFLKKCCCSDEGLTLKMSALQTLLVVNFHYQLS